MSDQVIQHLNTVREFVKKGYGGVIGAQAAEAALDLIEAAYEQRDKAFLDLLEASADKEAEVERLRTELAALGERLQREQRAADIESDMLTTERNQLRAELAAAREAGRGEVRALVTVLYRCREKIIDFAVQLPMSKRDHGTLLHIIDTLLAGFDPDRSLAARGDETR